MIGIFSLNKIFIYNGIYNIVYIMTIFNVLITDFIYVMLFNERKKIKIIIKIIIEIIISQTMINEKIIRFEKVDLITH